MQYLKRYKTLLIVAVAVGLVAALAWAGKIFVHEFTPLKAEVRADLLSQLREMQELAQTIKKPTSVYEVVSEAIVSLERQSTPFNACKQLSNIYDEVVIAFAWQQSHLDEIVLLNVQLPLIGQRAILSYEALDCTLLPYKPWAKQ